MRPLVQRMWYFKKSSSVISNRWSQSICIHELQHNDKQILVLFSKGDYDVVINDYEKAKSLFGNTEVPVFKKGLFTLTTLIFLLAVFIFLWNEIFFCSRSCPAVYAEVETRIEALRRLLLDKLLQTPSTLHDQKRYIRYECSPVKLSCFLSAESEANNVAPSSSHQFTCQQATRSHAQSNSSTHWLRLLIKSINNGFLQLLFNNKMKTNAPFLRIENALKFIPHEESLHENRNDLIEKIYLDETNKYLYDIGSWITLQDIFSVCIGEILVMQYTSWYRGSNTIDSDTVCTTIYWGFF